MGVRGMAYAHEVNVTVEGGDFRTVVLFVEDLPLPGLLGRRGFFDNFCVTFDHSSVPPMRTYERIVRA